MPSDDATDQTDLIRRVRDAGIPCPGCMYDLSGLTGPSCPECNREIRQSDLSDSFGALAKRLGPAAWLGIIWAVLPALGGFVLLANMAPVSEWLRSHQVAGYWIYIGIFIVSAGLGFLPTYSQAVLAGYAFGALWGFPAALAGFVGASLVGRIIAKRYAQERVERELGAHKKAAAIRSALVGRGFWPTLGIVTLVRVPPNSPFALTNLALSATGVPLSTYLIGTALGMSPRTLAAAVIGAQITDWSDSSRPKWLIIGGIALTLVAVVIIGQIATKAVQKLAETGDDSAEQPAEREQES